MAMPKKLDTFVLRDRLGLSQDALKQEAEASSLRRTEVMGWFNTSVRSTDLPSQIEGDYRCFTFEIWGEEKKAAPTISRISSKRDLEI
jgi:hypothetical protein